MRKIYSLGTAALLAVAACDQGPLDPPQMVIDAGGTSATATEEEVNLCKVGDPGTFNFTIVGPAAQIAPPNGQGASADVDSGQCVRIAFGGGTPYNVTATENVPAGFVLDSIVVDQLFAGVVTTTKITGTNQATAQAGGNPLAGAVITFYNSAEPTGGEGCTPGYWRQAQHFGNYTAPYAPNTLFNDVFAGGFNGQTLSQVAALGGGGLNALGRHAVAALLNAANPNVDYGMTVAEVIAAYNAVWNGTAAQIEAQKDIFEALNEQGCPLGRATL